MDVKNLQHKLNLPYNIDNWKEIVQFVFPNVSLLENPLEIHTESQKITKFIQFGNVRLSDGKVLALFDIKLADGVNLQRNRVELNNEVSKHIDQEQIHGVLSVFDQGKDDYRFTFSARSSEFDEEEGDFVAIKTDTKRYTYVLGKNESCKTPAKRFFELSQNKENAEIGDLQKAFSVEKLSKEFFDKYKFQFEKFWNYINSHEEYRKLFLDNDKDKQIRDFTKKLLGRVVFLHFLQKKGWMGCDISSTNWENGEKQFMQKLFNGFSDKTHFHSKCLHQLFFNTLNNNKRENYIFQCEGASDELNNTKIPYLNGGLFDADKEISEQIDFPEDFFIDLFDLFSQYNFTIDENDPNDHEVGIDPEMLGHIFENLLEDNKDKGAFYTPKVIVQYMCQESLIEYLATKLNASPDTELKIAIVDLVRNRLAQGINDLDKVEAIAQALHIVKICDPAIGSGAFPMGILNEIFKIVDDLYHLQPDVVAPIWDINSEIWEPNVVKKSIIQNSIYGVDLESGAVDIARLRFWLALIVDETEPLPLPNLDYKIMQGNSLLESYEGIDLSKIADVEAYEEFVSNEQIDMFTGEVKKKIKTSVKVEDIQQLIHEYFSTSDPENKKDLHDRIDEQVFNHIKFQINNFKIDLKNNIDILESKLERDVNAARTEEQKKKIRNNSKTAKDLIKNKTKLSEYVDKDAELNRIIKSNDKPFFLWNLYFKEVFDQGGFDIVIGNPPYVEHKKLKHISSFLKNKYKVYTGSSDLSVYFFEKGFDLLKENGTFSFINTNKFFNTGYGKALRSYLTSKSISKLINFEQVEVFEGVLVSSVVFIANNRNPNSDNLISYIEFKNEKNWKHSFTDNLLKRVKYIQQSNYDENEWVFEFGKSIEIKNKIEKIGTKIKDIPGVEIKRGVTTGYDPAFLIEKHENVMFNKDKEIVRPLLKGREIKKYLYSKSNYELIFIPWHFPLQNDKTISGASKKAELLFKNTYGDLYQHLYQHYEGLNNRNKSETGITYEWYCLQRCAASYNKLFIEPKIIWPLTADKWGFTIDLEGHYLTSGGFFLVSQQISLYYLLGILNSSLMNYYFKFIGVMTAGGAYTLKKATIEVLPLILSEDKIQRLIISLVNNILITRNKIVSITNNETNKLIGDTFEEIIDALVFELYFPEDFKEKNIEIAKHVKELFKPLEGLSEEEQLSKIDEVYRTYKEKSNPLRNQIKLMKIELSELLLPILSI